MTKLTIRDERGKYVVAGDKIRGRQSDTGIDVFTGREVFDSYNEARAYIRRVQRRVSAYERIEITH